MLRFSCLLCIAVVLTPSGHAADKDKTPEKKPGDAMIEKYLADKTAEISKKEFDGAKTLKEWQARRPRLQQEYFEMLGLWPLPERTPLHAQVTGTIERDDFAVEKVHFQSKPGLYVTGNLYRPKKVDGKLPAVLYVCGHSGKGRNGNKTAFQDHGMWFAKSGYICLVIDTLQLGEIAGIHHGTYNQNRWWWQARGYTSAGVECWNGVRAIDYLVSRPDVDAKRIAVTGISGGGAATLWIAAADERVKVAVPVSGMSDLESYVSNKIINGHCDCMLMINTYQWEWTTIACLVAPRPMLFANSDNDRIFPMDGNKRIITRLRRLYKMYDKPELVDDYVSVGGHDYRPDLRVAIFKWINKHIKNDIGPVKDSADFKLFANEELRVFPKDDDIPRDALNGKIDETFVPLAQVKLPEEGKFDEWKTGLMKELRARSFRTMPEKIPRLRVKFGSALSDGADWTFETERNVQPIHMSVTHPKAESGRAFIIMDEAGNADWSKPYLGDSIQYRFHPRGVADSIQWTKKSPPNYVERAHALIGQTVDQGRLWDMVLVLNDLDPKPEEKWKIVGRGQSGILAAYAALFVPTIGEVVIVDPPASHREGPIFLNVLRVLDIPDALGMLAPRPLTLVNAKDKGFDRTAQIYKRAGAEGKLQRK